MPASLRPPKPDLPLELQGLIVAFFDLSTCRQLGMSSVGPIPHTDMLIWLDRWCHSREAFDLYLEIIPQLDSIYMDHIRQESEVGRLKKHRS